jgi:hypothetical protein
MKISIAMFFLCLALSLAAQTQPPRSISASRLDGRVLSVDGLLNEPAWQSAVWQDEFTQHQPVEGAAPYQKTTFAVLFDDNNVYVGVRAFDNSPDSIVNRLSRRDDPDGDLIGIEFDTFNDGRTAFAFIVTSAGVKYDFVISDDGAIEDPTWDPIWWVKTSADSLGWYAEARIPLSQLRFGKNHSDGWGVQVGRQVFRKQEMSLWQPAERAKNSWVSQFGRLNGIDGIEPRRMFDFTPYVVARTERFKKDPENPFRTKGHRQDISAGFDSKIGVTSNLTFDVTVNPDFGQVEADPSQVNLSTYETFFTEKRPFFIEGKNILSFPLMFGDGDLSTESLFYTRRIGRRPHLNPDVADNEFYEMPEFTRILGAAKLTGKTSDGWSVGLLESVTSREFADIRNHQSDREVEVEPLTNFFVGRLQKDFNGGNTWLGGMMTAVNRNLRTDDLDFLHKSAYTGGLDFVHKWDNKTWELNVSSYFSHVTGSENAITETQKSWGHLFQRPDATHLKLDTTRTSLTGQGGKILIGKMGGNLKFMSAVAWKSPGLELNDIGYMRQADNIFQVFWAGYRIYKPFSIFRDFNGNFNQWTEWNFGGTLINPGGNINLHANLKNYWDVHWGINYNGTTIRTSELRGGPALKTPASWNTWWAFGSNNQKKLTLGMNGNVNRSFENRYRESEHLNVSVGYRPTKTLRISVTPAWSHQHNSLQYVNTAEVGNITRYIFGTIRQNTVSASLRVNLNLTPELSLQYWGQPFIASGKYTQFKMITNSMADNYYDRFRVYAPGEVIWNTESEVYRVQEASGLQYTFEQPDFSVKEFLSNLVIRWEYEPGSTLFLVWSQNRKSYHETGSFDFSRDLGRLFGEFPHDVWLVKFSYRLGR